MIVIDAKNLIIGRFATFAAKQALLGKEVRIINAEKAVISGKKMNTVEKFSSEDKRGIPSKGPFMPKVADRYVRRIIRGMLPYKQPKGVEAYKRVLCYKGVPSELESVTPTPVPGADASKLPTLNRITVEDLLKRFR